MDDIVLNIADIHIAIRSMDENIVLGNDDNYMAFQSLTGKFDYLINIHSANDEIMSRLADATFSFAWDNCWEYYTNRNGEQIYKAKYTDTKNRNRIRILIYNENSNTANLYISRNNDEKYIYRYGELLLFMSIVLEKYQGIIVHTTACSLKNYGGMLFCGKSGNGKSTISKIIKNYFGESVQVLTDDRAILRYNDRNVILYGTPWHSSSKYYLNSKDVIKDVYFIKHGSNNEMNKIRKSVAFQYLISNSFCTYWYQLESKSYRIISDIIKGIDFYEFGFLPNKSAAKYIEQKMNSNE